MPRIKIDKDKCKGCLLCVAACPKGLIVRSKKLNKRGMHCVEFSEKSEPVRRSISSSKNHPGEGGCTGCAMCAIMCPDVCIEVYR